MYGYVRYYYPLKSYIRGMTPKTLASSDLYLGSITAINKPKPISMALLFWEMVYNVTPLGDLIILHTPKPSNRLYKTHSLSIYRFSILNRFF